MSRRRAYKMLYQFVQHPLVPVTCHPHFTNEVNMQDECSNIINHTSMQTSMTEISIEGNEIYSKNCQKYQIVTVVYCIANIVSLRFINSWKWQILAQKCIDRTLGCDESDHSRLVQGSYKVLSALTAIKRISLTRLWHNYRKEKRWHQNDACKSVRCSKLCHSCKYIQAKPS